MEWNPNKTHDGTERGCRVAERVNKDTEHTASLSTSAMLDMLGNENPNGRLAYYEKAVRTEHMHDFHYPDPLGPPNQARPCAKLLKGTSNVRYCANGYPRDMVCQPGERSVAQDSMRPDLWRVNLCGNSK